MADLGIQQTNSSSDIAGKIFLSAIIFLILGAGIGIAVDKFIFTSVPSKNVSNTSQSGAGIATGKAKESLSSGLLNDPTSILSNSVFTEWSGSAEGKVVEKDKESFTLEKNGGKLKIYIQKSLTFFIGDEISPGNRKKLTFDQIPVGTLLRGGVTISRGSLSGNANQHVAANGFMVIKELGK